MQGNGKGGLEIFVPFIFIFKIFYLADLLQRSNGFKIHQKKQFYEVKILQ